jgi:4-amino-4-deoxy-L-arabinose transferase-like glycosyltransferase
MHRLAGFRRERLVILLFLLASSIFLFADSTVPPVALRDEARNAINAIEMYLRGFSLITTFEFQPDLWNTKPPLMIWMMSAGMTLFGPSEWALRLPSALAAMGTLSCTLFFVRRITGSLATAVAAAAVLLLSPGFFGEHGARTADFDAPLTFFVTAGLQLLFFAVHRARPGIWRMIAIGGLIAAGALTKSVAAFIPVAGVLLYLLAVGRLKRVLSQSHLYAVAAMAAVAPLLTFYALREAAGPGYVSAVIHNDVAGRFSENLIAATGPFYYVTELSLGWFFAGPFLLGAPFAFRSCSGRARLLFLYSASIAGVSLLVYSAASNRALQYALPMYPWLSIIAALTLRYVAQFLADTWRDGKKALAIGVGAAFLLVSGQLIYRAAFWRYQAFPSRQFYPQSSYGNLFADLSARGVTTLTVIDPGQNHHGRVGYAPLLRWNRLIWQERGMTIVQELKQEGSEQGPLASCEPHVFNRWTGPAVERVGSCAVLWRQ